MPGRGRRAGTDDRPPRLRGRARARAALRKPANWLQLVRFGTVGASGYVVNLAVFAAAVHGAGFDYGIAATARVHRRAEQQLRLEPAVDVPRRRRARGLPGGALLRRVAARRSASTSSCSTRSSTASGMAEVPAQALAIATATPLNFIGNKLWSFKA